MICDSPPTDCTVSRAMARSSSTRLKSVHFRAGLIYGTNLLFCQSERVRGEIPRYLAAASRRIYSFNIYSSEFKNKKTPAPILQDGGRAVAFTRAVLLGCRITQGGANRRTYMPTPRRNGRNLLHCAAMSSSQLSEFWRSSVADIVAIATWMRPTSV